MLAEPGRVCIKKNGRDAGSRAVITKVENENFVKVVTAKRGKERRCNIRHLELLNEKVDPRSQDEISKALGIKK
ncbi:MAG: 50S ribosomal protein L14e [Candidatus Micrarchaeia archaeon]